MGLRSSEIVKPPRQVDRLYLALCLFPFIVLDGICMSGLPTHLPSAHAYSRTLGSYRRLGGPISLINLIKDVQTRRMYEVRSPLPTGCPLGILPVSRRVRAQQSTPHAAIGRGGRRDLTSYRRILLRYEARSHPAATLWRRVVGGEEALAAGGLLAGELTSYAPSIARSSGTPDGPKARSLWPASRARPRPRRNRGGACARSGGGRATRSTPPPNSRYGRGTYRRCYTRPNGRSPLDRAVLSAHRAAGSARTPLPHVCADEQVVAAAAAAAWRQGRPARLRPRVIHVCADEQVVAAAAAAAPPTPSPTTPSQARRFAATYTPTPPLRPQAPPRLVREVDLSTRPSPFIY